MRPRPNGRPLPTHKHFSAKGSVEIEKNSDRRKKNWAEGWRGRRFSTCARVLVEICCAGWGKVHRSQQQRAGEKPGNWMQRSGRREVWGTQSAFVRIARRN